MALGIGPGDEVITPTFSFFATAGCVSRARRDAVLVDIDPVTFNIDPAAVGAAITPRTRAIIPVHLYGQCADMDPILDARASAAASPVIEDAAQAIGATYKGRQAGRWARPAASRSFPSKNLGAFGDGGLRDDQRRGARARSCGCCATTAPSPKYFHKRIGGNFRLDALQAAVLRVKLPHLGGGPPRAGATRTATTRCSRRAGSRIASRCRRAPPDRSHIFNQYVIRVPDRDAVRARLDADAASAPRSTTRCRSTCRSASRRSATARGDFPARRGAPRTRRSRCRSTASSPTRSSSEVVADAPAQAMTQSHAASS